MKRTTLFAEEETLLELRYLAQKRGVSTAEIMREALASYVAARQKRRKLPSFVGIGKSGRKDTSERIEELLWSDPEWRERHGRI